MTRDEAIQLRQQQHAYGLLSLVRIVEHGCYRVGEDAHGRVFEATHHPIYGWSRWRRANTHSFERFARYVSRLSSQ